MGPMLAMKPSAATTRLRGQHRVWPLTLWVSSHLLDGPRHREGADLGAGVDPDAESRTVSTMEPWARNCSRRWTRVTLRAIGAQRVGPVEGGVAAADDHDVASGVRVESGHDLLRLRDFIPDARHIAENGSKICAPGSCEGILPCRSRRRGGAIAKGKPHEASLFCSQLVMEAYDKITSPLLPGIETKKIAPGHLVASPYLEDVTNQALRRVTSSDEPSWCLDDTSPFKRPHQWEVITKLKMLGRKPIQRVVKRLNGNARSFYELELLLRDTKDAELDRAIVTALVATDFCDIYYSKTVDRFDGGEETARKPL